MQIDNPESWKISAEERAKHTATFMQLNPAPGGLLSGDQAKGFFLKSGLPMPVLGQIWNLADLNKDGKLDVKEFSIACFLIKRALTSPQGPACIPPTLPHSLLVDPTSSSSSIAATPIIGQPKTNIVLPATTTPLIGASPLIMPSTTTTTPLIPASSNTPLFQANFPPMSQTPIVGLSAPHTTATATPLVGLGSTPLFPLGATATSPPHLTQLAPASTSTPMAPLTSAQLPGAVFTPLVPLNQPTAALPNPLSPIPQTSRSKYGQMFQSNDPTSSGFITGNQARTLLMQTGLAQPILAQIWNLADYDKDGKLTYEEFILAMHLCDYAKTGATLPGTLPADLIPPRSRSSSLVGNSIAPALTTTLTTATTGGAMTGFDAIAAADASPTLSAKQQGIAATFEDKRRENFDRGAAVLEAKRAALREQEEREKREREEKERLEQEKRQRIREEQEKRRLAEIERAQERQRQIDAQREEERRKAHEQREQARNELIRQQRLEWEKQKRLELEQTRLKLQEQLSTLKAKDKNLEYDLHALNDKISSYKTKISDNQTNLTELNQRLDVTKKSYAHKQGECEASENELKEITQMLSRLGQEKLVLNEQLKNLNADSPFAEEYRNDSHQLKQKQSAIQQLRADVEAIETRINSTRTQLEIVRHELEVTRGDEADYERENERLRSLLDIKRGVIPSNKIPASMSNGSLAKQVSNSANIMKSSQSNGSLRSATPKENYAAFKDEIMKIQQTTNTPPPTTTTADPFGGTSSTADPFGGSSTTALAAAEFSSDWSAAFDSSSANQAAATEDPFASGIDPFAVSSSGQEPTSSDFDPFGMPATNAANLSSSVSGFGDDNWAAFAAASNSTIEATNNSSSSVTNNEAVAANNAITNTNATTATPNSPPPIDAFSNQDNSNSNAANNSSNWAAFDDGPTNTTTNGGVKNAVDFFNSQQQPVSSPTTKNSTMTPSNSFQQRLSSANSIKYRAMYQFDASREDELSIKEGDIVNVDISVKTDDGWVWGELNGRTGVFPAAFAAKLSDLEGHSQPDYSALGNVNLPMQSGANVAADSHIINYYMSVYAYESSEPGDLVFGEYEIINVVSQNEDWFTGEVVGAEQSRRGIFPTNFVIKFNLPLEYIGKYTISIATEIYAPMNPGELSLDPNHNQLIAIKKVSPDGKWSFGESYDTSGKMSRGWFPIGSASALIPSGATPLYSPNQTAMSNGPKSPTAANGASLATNNISTASSPEPPPPTSTTSPSTPEAVAAVATADVADSATVASVTAAIATDNDGTSAANNAINASSTVTTNNNHTNGSNGTSNGVEKPTTVKKSTTNGSISSTSKTVASSENRAQTPPQVAAVAEIEKSPSSPSTTSGSQGANDSGASQQSPPSTAAAAPPTQVIDRVVALYDFNPTTPEAIGFPKDAVINILDKSGDWWYGEYNGKIGILPYNYVQSIATDNPTNG